jgi:N-carbamoylputrescine amidase
MANVVRAALVQATWTGDTESMVAKHEEHAREAARQGARIIGFQEVFNAPYFCQVQEPEHYSWAEPVPDGPTVRRMRELARETGMVVVVPVFDTAVGKVGVYICYDRHFPEGWRQLGLNGAQLVYNPSATSRGLSSYLWQLEQPAAAVANEYFVAAINRVGQEQYGDNDFYGTSYFVDPRGQVVGEVASDKSEELVVRDLDFDVVEEVRQQWAFYRDRRPDAYEGLVQP